MSANSAVFWLCLCMAFLWVGIEIGMENPHKPAPRPAFRCPVVQGQEVVSSHDSRDGQFCTYANSYGRATHNIRVAP